VTPRKRRIPVRQSPHHTKEDTMANLTYSEAAQKAGFKHARELRRIAGEVLRDTAAPSAAFTRRGAVWAVSVARNYALLAHEVENAAHELAVASNLDETLNGKSKDAYSAAVDEFEGRGLREFDADWKSVRDVALGW
jgi:hypothetical protein